MVNGVIYVVTVTSKGLNPIRLWAQDWSIAMLAEMDAKWATLPINCWIIEKSCPPTKANHPPPIFSCTNENNDLTVFRPRKTFDFLGNIIIIIVCVDMSITTTSTTTCKCTYNYGVKCNFGVLHIVMYFSPKIHLKQGQLGAKPAAGARFLQ